jgi:serine/threonine protein kinase
VLISDFGESRVSHKLMKRTGGTGTLLYCAPEILAPSANQFETFSPTSASHSTSTPSSSDSSSHRNSRQNTGSTLGDDNVETVFEYTEACDIWSLGIILYALCFAALPYYGDSPG